MGDFRKGDFVWFQCDGRDVYGTLGHRMSGVNAGRFFVEDVDGIPWGVLPGEMKLVNRPQSTDYGAQEYEEIMSLQNVPPSTD